MAKYTIHWAQPVGFSAIAVDGTHIKLIHGAVVAEMGKQRGVAVEKFLWLFLSLLFALSSACYYAFAACTTIRLLHVPRVTQAASKQRQ